MDETVNDYMDQLRVEEARDVDALAQIFVHALSDAEIANFGYHLERGSRIACGAYAALWSIVGGG